MPRDAREKKKSDSLSPPRRARFFRRTPTIPAPPEALGRAPREGAKGDAPQEDAEAGQRGVSAAAALKVTPKANATGSAKPRARATARVALKKRGPGRPPKRPDEKARKRLSLAASSAEKGGEEGRETKSGEGGGGEARENPRRLPGADPRRKKGRKEKRGRARTRKRRKRRQRRRRRAETAEAAAAWRPHARVDSFALRRAARRGSRAAFRRGRWRRKRSCPRGAGEGERQGWEGHVPADGVESRA